MKEIDIFGIYVSPFAAELLAAIILFLLLRRWFDRIEIQQWFWHRRLFDSAVFLIILSVIGLLF